MAYSDRFYEQQSGIIELKVPYFSKVDGSTSTESIKGILQDDPQIQLGNNWGTLNEFDDLLNPLRDIQQVVKTDNITNYVSATGMAWKGTPHIKVNCNFYLIAFNSKSNINKKAMLLSQLCTVFVSGGYGVKVHGGYQLDYYKNNETLELGTFNDSDFINSKVDGTVTMIINSPSHTVINGLLAQTINIQPSTVCVRDGSPLYYVVSAGFTGYRAPITSDMHSIYGRGR